MEREKVKKVELEFMETSSIEGFASKSVTSDNAANPDVIVRELVQNGLDAARDADRQKAEIDFIFDEIKIRDIPGIGAYRKAFEAAAGEHVSEMSTAEAQIERIQNSLKKTTISVLHIRDNGVGLDAVRMNALLGDGMTNKDGAASMSVGSYGLGHYTAFPSSDLQYILYGGVTAKGTMIMSAHAILASHIMDNEIKGKDGYFISGKQVNIRSRYQFPTNEDVPSVMRKFLKEISATNNGSGSVISILAFNNFRANDADPAEAVMEAVARHFFPAIYKEQLAVSVIQGNKKQTLDMNSLNFLIQKKRDEKRRIRTDDTGLNGHKAYAAYRTLISGNCQIVDTGFGKVALYMRDTDADEITRINLFRSGMFITDQVPMNTAAVYRSFLPFNAVLLLDAPPLKEGNMEIAYQVIRRAEGEKHVDLNKERLPNDLKKIFEPLFRTIQNEIRAFARKDNSDSYSPESFMLLDKNNDSTLHLRNKKSNKLNSPLSLSRLQFTPLAENINEIVDSEIAEKREREYKRKGKHQKPHPGKVPISTFNRSGRNAPVSCVARREGREVRLSLHTLEYVANAGLRLLLDRGADPTCTQPLPDPFLAIMQGATVNGVLIPEEAHIKANGNIYEVLLGSMNTNTRCHVKVHLVENILDDAILKVNIVSRHVEDNLLKTEIVQ